MTVLAALADPGDRGRSHRVEATPQGQPDPRVSIGAASAALMRFEKRSY